MLRTLLLLALAPVASRAADSDRTLWKIGAFTWVKLVPAEPGAPANAHPAGLSPDVLQATLGPVQVKDDGKEIPLFGREELKELAKALSGAFAQAQPGQDLVLLSTGRHGASFLERATALTARLFLRDGALNLIVHDDRLDFMDQYLVDSLMPTFVYGSRKTASKQQLQAPGGTRQRGDWLTLPLVAPAPAPVYAPAVAAAPAPAPAPALAPPPAVPAPAPKAVPEIAAPAARDGAFYEAQALRLKALKHLRDENLITEAEYQERREAILKTL
jgi:hypothetical protein